MARLCLITDEFAPATKGGIGRLLAEAAGALAQAGWQITVLFLGTRADFDTSCAYVARHLPGCRVVRVDDLLASLAPEEDIPLWAFHFLPYHQSYRVALALRELLRNASFDLIEFADYRGLGYVTLKWRRLLGAPFSDIRIWLRLHGTYELWQMADEALTHTRQELHTFQMERYCLRYADGWLCPSDSVAAWYRSHYQIADKPNCVSVPPFQKLGPGGAHHRTLRRPVEFLFYGKLQRLKGAAEYIRAGAQVCERAKEHVTFHLVGHDVRTWALGRSFGSELRRLIPPRWRSRFIFHGHIRPEALPAIANRCSAAVVPSRVETFCLAAHELNWLGIPLILRDIPAFVDFFEDGRDCGKYRVNNDDPADALAHALLDMLDRPYPFEQWVWNGPGIVARQRLADAYRAAIAQPAPSAPLSAGPQPLVSVIVPFFNAENTLRQTLTSIEASTYRQHEVILVNDGSTSPGSRAMFEQLATEKSQDSRYRFIDKTNGGLSSARNAGLEVAQGEFVLPLDADDVIHADYLAMAVRALTSNPELCAVSCFANYFQDDKPPTDAVDYVIAYDLDPLMITLENRAGVAGSVFRRQQLPTPAYRETLPAYEDWDLWWSLAERHMLAEAMPKILYHYRRRAAGLYASVGRQRHHELVRTMESAHPALLAQLPTRPLTLRQMQIETGWVARIRRRLRDWYVRLRS